MDAVIMDGKMLKAGAVAAVQDIANPVSLARLVMEKVCKTCYHKYTPPQSQVYIPKRRTLIQVLPPASAYTKSAHAYIHFDKFFRYLLMHVCIFIAIRPVCVHHGVRIGCLIAILRQNAYMHEQIT